jgi:DNA-binding response OmpR family regulator
MEDPAKILVVDDEDAGRFVKVQTLKRAGYVVVETATGYEALELAAKELPDLAILDVNLPDISGLEVARRLRKEYASLPGIQILQISNTAITPADQGRGLPHGADVYLTEPVEPTVLIATVQSLLRVRKAETALAHALAGEREARLVAEQAIDLAFRKLGRTPPRGSMEGVSIWGGEESAQEEAPTCVTAAAERRLREAYGSRAGEVALLYREESGWAEPISPGCPVLRCEVLHAVREEMALKLSDVVFRRTDLGTAGCPPSSHIDAVARVMGKEMAWTRAWEVQEVGEVLKSYTPLPLRKEKA